MINSGISWEISWYTVGYHGIYRWYPLVSSASWLENPGTEWRFLARKITGFYVPFSSQLCLMTPEGSFDTKLWSFTTGWCWCYPLGMTVTLCDIENCHWKFVSFPSRNGDFPCLCKRWPEGKLSSFTTGWCKGVSPWFFETEPYAWCWKIYDLWDHVLMNVGKCFQQHEFLWNIYMCVYIYIYIWDIWYMIHFI